MRTLLLVLLVILSIIVVVSVLLQPAKTDGLNSLLSGGATETFFSKNKSRTHEAFLARVTIIASMFFAAIVIALNFVK